MKKLEFTLDKEGKSRYEICCQAILAAGRPIQPSEWDDFLPLKRKFVGLGEAAVKQPSNAHPDRPVIYDLAQAGTVELERGEFSLLQDLVKQPNWVSSVLEDVIMVRDWLGSIKEYDSNGVVRA